MSHQNSEAKDVQQNQQDPLTQPSTDYLSKCSNRVNGGFGQEYISSDQPFAQMNRPIKKKASLIRLIVISILNIALLSYPVNLYFEWILYHPLHVFGLFILYTIYLMVSIQINQTKCFLNSPKKFSTYKNAYSGMTEGDTFLKFWIKCYHYRGAGKHRRKVTSHSASQDYFFEKIEDNSGILENIQKSSEHVFITFTKGYSFGDGQTKQNVRKSFNKFVGENITDRYQTYWHTLNIVGLQKYNDYVSDPSSVSVIPYYFCLIFCLFAPYLLFMETKITRYEIKITKILTGAVQQ